MLKRLLLLSIIFLTSTLLLQAQSDENRNKLEMTISFGGKSVVSDIISVSTSISRYSDYYDALPKDSAAKQGPPIEKRSPFALTMQVRKMKPELFAILAKKANRFAGTITIVDTYGKNPTTTIKFTEASLDTYSDQFSGSSYSDGYYGASLSLSCKTMSINGIEIEP